MRSPLAGVIAIAILFAQLIVAGHAADFDHDHDHDGEICSCVLHNDRKDSLAGADPVQVPYPAQRIILCAHPTHRTAQDFDRLRTIQARAPPRQPHQS